MNNFNIDDIFEQFYYKTPDGSRDECFKFIRKNRAIIEAAILNKVPEIEPLFKNIKTITGLKKKLKEKLNYKYIQNIIATDEKKLNKYQKDTLYRYYAMSREDLTLVVYKNLNEKERKSLKKYVYHKTWVFNEHRMHYLQLNLNFLQMNQYNFRDYLFEQEKYFSKIDFMQFSERKKNKKKYNLDIYLFNKSNKIFDKKILFRSINFYYLVEGSKIFLHEKNYELYNLQTSYIYGRMLQSSLKTFFRLKFNNFFLHNKLNLLDFETCILHGGYLLFCLGIRKINDIDLETSIDINKYLECFYDLQVIKKEYLNKSPIFFNSEKNYIAFGNKCNTVKYEIFKRTYRGFNLVMKRSLVDLIVIKYIYEHLVNKNNYNYKNFDNLVKSVDKKYLINKLKYDFKLNPKKINNIFL